MRRDSNMKFTEEFKEGKKRNPKLLFGVVSPAAVQEQNYNFLYKKQFGVFKFNILSKFGQLLLLWDVYLISA